MTLLKRDGSGSTKAEIAASLERAMHEGRLAAGEALPTVRALAARLSVSTATVAAAYSTLRRRGLVVSDGRRGTRVRGAAPTAFRPVGAMAPASTTATSKASVSTAPASTAAATVFPKAGSTGFVRTGSTRGPTAGLTVRPVSHHLADLTDLASGNPDPDLLPPLGPALRTIDASAHLYGAPVHLRALIAFAAAELTADGVPADAVTLAGGALDAIERVLREHLRIGDRVGMEDPTLPALRDLVETAGYLPVPMAMDDEGPLLADFETALRQRVRAVIVTPRAQNPSGAAFSTTRAADLRRVLRAHADVLLVENDAAGPVAGAPFHTLVAAAHERWVVVRSTSKCLGPDLRVAVMAGDAQTIARMQHRQILGTRWVSHILQQLVLALWSDPASGRQLARANDTYAQRRSALVSALAMHGIAAHGKSGLNVWVPVFDEAASVRALAQRGWLVAAGERFRFKSGPGIRVTTAALRVEDAARLADDVAAVEQPSIVALA